MSTLDESTRASAPDEWRRNAFVALEAGSAEEAHTWLRQALSASIDLEGLNDLAVIAHRLGRGEEAKTLLRAALAIEPTRGDVATNLAALEQLESADGWRGSSTLGGTDPDMYERAFPGMPRPDIISEHCSRYAFALSLVGGAHVLDLGCGTGYGSEMLSWSAASVRGFDLWRPAAHEHPRWPGVTKLSYGHDLCADPLPPGDAAVMFEVIEHLPDAPRALQIAWRSVDMIIGSFPNPVHHGSWMNQYHVNDWPLEQFERELQRAAAAAGRGPIELTHYHQRLGDPLLVEGRDPEASYWVVVARVAGIDSKERAELDYWEERKRIEGELTNAHYADLFTTHLGLRPEFYAGKRVLDVGCGPRGSLEWADMAARRVGIDPLAESYGTLRTAPHKMEYVAAPAETMPFPDGSFDVVTSVNSLDHVEDLDRVVAEIKRVLAPGGHFVLLTDVNHDATPCEPQSFSWDIVDQFVPELELLDQSHYEKNQSSMLESLRSALPYDHSRPERRYGIVAAQFVKRAATSGAVALDAAAGVTVQNSVAPAVSITPDMPMRDYWHARAQQHTADRYLGIKMSKFPEDLRVYEQLLWIAAPTVVVELGAQSGGSTLWLRDRLRTLAGYRAAAPPPLVISVDIDLSVARRNVAARDPQWADSIVFVEGDVCDPAVRAEVGLHLPLGAECLVIEDSAHVESTTAAALELYSDLVPVGGFFVVEDGCVDVDWMRISEDWPRGVLPALHAWLATPQGAAFSVRRDLEVYGVSCHPSGFLQRVA